MFESLRKFIERGRKGYCYEDLWSFDNWLSKTIANGLREFKKNCHGYPSEDVTWEGWMTILDEMIECFDEQVRDIENFDVDMLSCYKERMKNKKVKLNRGLELLEKYYYDLWD